ncbi:DUF1642 domain-containing protein [Enterococcus faecalis]|uniref:DUF1642 domain-containing protein n=1 Tax=Enterococcus faecalis TaxID=1351 RepID=UPI001A95FDAD|nr:DUF1642 domain-containing protein [Enterococcus faecalis]MBO1136590.1 DUF1642 domain-containing protein [Enterococcus faecalis]
MDFKEKEDLIQALYDIGGCDAEDEWSRGYDDGVNAAIEVIKELKVHGKVIFSHEEKFVADWLNDLRGQISDVKLNSGAVFMTFIGRQLERYYDEEYSFLTEKIESWLTVPKNKVKLMSAIDNGYEVEKEQLYYVDFMNDGDVHKRLILDHENGKCNIVGWSDNLIGLVQEMFTEQEIKTIDERYWLFKEEVDGE